MRRIRATIVDAAPVTAAATALLLTGVVLGGCGRSAPDEEARSNTTTTVSSVEEAATTTAHTLSPAGVQADPESSSAMAGAKAVSDQAVVSVAPTTTTAPTTIPPPQDQTYVVQSGDSISTIAAKFDVSIDDIRRANPTVEDINKIKVGQELIIPGL